jgi:hypothetical protein
MCTHAASERASERDSERDNERGEKTVRLPIPSGYQSEGWTTPSYQSCSVTDSTRAQIGGIVRETIVRLPTMFGIRPVRLPSRGRRASGYRLPIRAIRGNGTPKDGQAGRRCRRLLRRASNPSHWRVVLYRFFGGKVRVSAFWRSLYHRPSSSAGQHFFAFSIHRFRNFLWAHFSTCAIQAVSSWLHKLLQFIDTCLQCFCWFRIGLKCDA